MKKLFSFIFFFSFIAPLFSENTSTLPEGRFRARLKPIYAWSFDTQYGLDGVEKSLASKYARSADVALMQKINTGIAGLMSGNGIQSLGDFVPSLEASSLVLGSALEYGLTSNLTLGVIVPFVSANTQFSLDFNKNPSALSSSNPYIRGATNGMLNSVKDLAAAKGYEPLENWDGFGLGDIELGIKYRFLNLDTWSLAAKSGVRLNTGRVDDPDRLTDVAFGDGQTDLGSTILADFIGLPNTLVNVMAKYTVQLPDREILRVPDDGELFTTKKENLRRNLGDRVDTAFYTEYTFLNNFNVNATYSFFSKEKDLFKSALGYYAEGLEKDTAQRRHAADMGIGFSTLPWFRKGTFALPMEAGLNVEYPFAGKNVAKATTLNFEYKLYF